MPFEDFVVCDSDMHVLEPADLWQRYIAARVQARGARRHDGAEARPAREGEVAGAAEGRAGAAAEGARRQRHRLARRAGGRLRRGRGEGLGRPRRSSTRCEGGRGPRRAVPVARAVRARRSTPPSRSAPTASSPSSPPRSRAPTTTGSTTSAALRPSACSARRWWRRTTSPPRSTRCGARSASTASRRSSSSRAPCGAGLGTTATTTRSGPSARRRTSPVCFHGGGRTSLTPDFSLEVFADRLMMWHTFNQPLGVMTAAVSLTAGGVLERFPELRIGLLEGNCSWAPWLLHRLDEHQEWVGWYEARDLTMKPSEYFMRQCFVSVDADEETVKHYVDWFDDSNLVFSTDFPHGDAHVPARGGGLPQAAALGGVATQDRRRQLEPALPDPPGAEALARTRASAEAGPGGSGCSGPRLPGGPGVLAASPGFPRLAEPCYRPSTARPSRPQLPAA